MGRAEAVPDHRRVSGHSRIMSASSGSPKDDTRIISRLVDRLHMKTHAKAGVPCIEDGKEIFETFHGVRIKQLIEDLQWDYETEESGLGVGWGS